MSDAIRFVLAKRGFTAGKYSIGFQSCDDSTAQARTWTPETCRRNARAYARQANLLGVIGTYNSRHAQRVEIPDFGAAPGGPVATVGSASTYIGLTRSGPGSEPGEPGKYYPRGVRNFARVVPATTSRAPPTRCSPEGSASRGSTSSTTEQLGVDSRGVSASGCEQAWDQGRRAWSAGTRALEAMRRSPAGSMTRERMRCFSADLST